MFGRGATIIWPAVDDSSKSVIHESSPARLFQRAQSRHKESSYLGGGGQIVNSKLFIRGDRETRILAAFRTHSTLGYWGRGGEAANIDSTVSRFEKIPAALRVHYGRFSRILLCARRDVPIELAAAGAAANIFRAFNAAR